MNAGEARSADPDSIRPNNSRQRRLVILRIVLEKLAHHISIANDELDILTPAWIEAGWS